MTSVLTLFRSNNDTQQIATCLGIDEHEAYNRAHAEREAERDRRMRKLIPYTGAER